MCKHDSKISLLLACFICGGSALAQEQRHHGAHEHGVGTLNLALEGTDVHVELASPALNIVGFEHAPSTEADQEAVEHAIAILEQGERIFRFAADVACRLSTVRVRTSLMDHEGRDSHQGHDDHGNGDDHEHEHGDEGADQNESHADVTAEYRFACARPDKLKQVDVRLFEAFPATQRLHVQFLTDRRQGAAELTASDHVLKF